MQILSPRTLAKFFLLITFGLIASGQAFALTPTTTTVALTTPTSTPVTGQSATFTATVAGSGGPPTAGSVTFTVTDKNNVLVATSSAILLNSGAATYTPAPLKASLSQYKVVAAYSGGGTFGPSDNSLAPLNQPVAKADTVISLAVLPASPGTNSASPTFTATVTAKSPGGGTPNAGSVQFTLDSGATPTTVAVVGGSAAYTPTLGYGHHQVTATYLGSSDYNAVSTTAPTPYDVNSSTTVSVTLLSPAGTPVTGQPVTFQAAVAANATGAGTPTGTVDFTIQDNTGAILAIGTGVALSPTGTASSTATPLSASRSPYTVTVSYTPTPGSLFNSTTRTLNQPVNPAATTTTVVLTPPPAAPVTGQSATYTATVAAVLPGAGTPAGTVTFTITGQSGFAPITPTQSLSGGQASITQALLAQYSPYQIQAVYTPNSTDFTTSSSSTLPQPVAKADTTTTANVSGDFNGSDTVNVVVTVAAKTPGIGTPGGKVQVQVDGKSVEGTPTLTAGSVTVTLKASDLAPGPVPNQSPHTVTVMYLGDSNFNTSDTSASPVSVNGLPVINGLSPSSGTSGDKPIIIILGDNFSFGPGNATVNTQVTFNGQTYSAMPVVTGGVFQPNQIQVQLDLTNAGSTPPGTYTVSVTNPTSIPGGGTSNSFPFTVNAATPVLKAINPNSGNALAYANIILTGVNFTDPLTDGTEAVQFAGALGTTYKASKLVLNSDGTLTLKNIVLPAASGNYSVTLTNSKGPSGPLTFTVTNNAPTLTNLSQTTGTGGTKNFQLTLTGTNFTSSGNTPAPYGNILTFTPKFDTANRNDTVTVANLDSLDGTTLKTSTLTLPPDAGPYKVTVTNGNGLTTNTQDFTVTLTAGTTLNSVTPPTETTGHTVNLTLVGTNFDPTPGKNTILFNGIAPAQTVTQVTKDVTDTLTATVTLPAAGSYTVSVQNVNGTSANMPQPPFTINLDNPTITSVTPNTGSASNTALTATIIGTNFDTAANNTVTLTAGSGDSKVTNTFPMNPPPKFAASATSPPNTTLPVTLDLTLFQKFAGQRGTLTVNNGTPGTSESNAVDFTISGKPTIVSINPNTGAAGGKVTVTLTGTNFDLTSNTVKLTFSGTTPDTVVTANTDPGKSPTLLPSTGGTTITAIFDLTKYPTLFGVGQITVYNNITTSDPIAFTVNLPIASKLTPASVLVDDPTAVINDPSVGKVLQLTITGANFAPGNEVTFQDSKKRTLKTFSEKLTPNNFKQTNAGPNSTITVLLPADPNPTMGLIDLIGQADQYTVSVDAGEGSTPSSQSSFTVTRLNSFAGPALQMFSLPYDYSLDANKINGSLSNVLGDISSAGVLTAYLPRVATWDNGQYDYTEGGTISPGNFADLLLIGRGYWSHFPDQGIAGPLGFGDSLIRRGTPALAVTALNPFTGITDNTTDPKTKLPVTDPRTGLPANGSSVLQEGNLFPIQLQPGWNMIGDPSTADVLLASIRVRETLNGTPYEDVFSAAVTAGVISPALYTYSQNPTPGDAKPGYVTEKSQIKAYTGYWLYANTACQLLVPVP